MSGRKKKSIRKPYGSFALAATAYVAGVILFSAWSYFSSQSALIAHNDALLEDAAFAIREILEPRYQADPASLGATPIEERERLARFVRNGDFALVGATARSGGATHTLVVGTDPDPSLSAFPMQVRELALDLAGFTGDGIATLISEHETLGLLRVTVLYLSDAPGEGVTYVVALPHAHVGTLLREQLIRTCAGCVFLLMMVIPLLSLHNRFQKSAASQLEIMNERLRHDVNLQKLREEELKDAICDLERFTSVTTGRESRIIELKTEVNVLLEELNRTQRYNTKKTN